MLPKSSAVTKKIVAVKKGSWSFRENASTMTMFQKRFFSFKERSVLDKLYQSSQHAVKF